MSQKQTMTINGREYDLQTGMPIVKSSIQPIKKSQNQIAQQNNYQRGVAKASSIHKKTQRSSTLNRHFVKKSTPKTSQAVQKTAPAAQPQQIIKTHSRRRIDGIRPLQSNGSAARANRALANSIKKKSGVALKPVQSTPIISLTTPVQKAQTETPMPHPIVERAHQKHAQKKEVATLQQPTLTASVLKQAAIDDAMAKAPKHHAKQHKQSTKSKRFFGIASAFAALVLFAGYLTYLNVPDLSVRVAAAQAGIDASYPSYQPDGYKLNGPVAFSDGEVRMQFAATTGDGDFTLKQSRSSWDSNALLENYVKDRSDNSYTTSQEKGITVYNFGGNAAWVSGGILYTIDGDAPLSPDQIRKIATSV